MAISWASGGHRDWGTRLVAMKPPRDASEQYLPNDPGVEYDAGKPSWHIIKISSLARVEHR